MTSVNTIQKPAPTFEGLGAIHFKITTKSPEAQRFFNQGVALLYAFNHAEAIRSFSAVTNLDGDCAMGYWGISYAHGPNINKPMDEAGNQKAWEALQQATRLKGERDTISAAVQLVKRFELNRPVFSHVRVARLVAIGYTSENINESSNFVVHEILCSAFSMVRPRHIRPI